MSNERTASESVPRSTAIEAERGTLGEIAERRPERIAERPGAPSVERPAQQAPRGFARWNDARNGVQNGNVSGCSARESQRNAPHESRQQATSTRFRWV